VYTNWVKGRAGLVSLVVWVVRQVGKMNTTSYIYIYITLTRQFFNQ
jgi:hypothetical protein